MHKSLNGMGISEEKIWQQLEAVPAAIALTNDLDRDIADALNASQQKSKAAVSSEIERYRDALRGLEPREDAFADLLANGSMTVDQYKRQMQRIREQRDEFTIQLEHVQHSINDAFMETAHSILELAIDAKKL